MKLIKIFSFILLSCFAISTLSLAASYDIKSMTPEIKQAISSRQARYSEIENAKAAKKIGENNRGYVEGFEKSDTLNALVALENRDRTIIYQAIAYQNNLGAKGLSKIEMVFAEVQRDKALNGEKIQLPDGRWVVK